MSHLLIISGTPGSGITAIGSAVHDLLSQRQIPHAFIDRDALTTSFPHEGSFNEVLAQHNIVSIWQNYQEAGARSLILSGVMETREIRVQYENLFPEVEIKVCRLMTPRDIREARLRIREEGASLDWHLNRAVALDQILDSTHVEDFTVCNGTRAVRSVAMEVLKTAGWRF